GNGSQRRGIEREARRCPGLLCCRQRGAEPRPFTQAALDEVSSPKRKCRRGPAPRQHCKRMPGFIGCTRGRAGPSEQHAIDETLTPQAIEQYTRALIVPCRGDVPPAVRH